MQDPETGVVVVVEDQGVSYGWTWAFHLGSRCACGKPYPHLDVVGGRVQNSRGVETLVQWVRLTLTVERFRYPIYSDNYGVEFDALISRSPTPEEVETEAPRMVREALSIDDRILEVRLVRVVPSEEDLTCYFLDMEVVTFTGDLEGIEAVSSQGLEI
jgi:hypothetical protein